jgi:hypothetical protein
MYAKLRRVKKYDHSEAKIFPRALMKTGIKQHKYLYGKKMDSERKYVFEQNQ